MKKYDLDYDTLSKINPRLIYTSITGYGQTGPYSNRPGFDVMVEAEFGLMHLTGTRDGPPVKVGVAVTDLTTGLYACNSIMAALLARANTGEGQHLDVCLSDCQVATLANMGESVLISGKKDSGRWGTAHRKFFIWVLVLTLSGTDWPILLLASVVPYQGFKTSDGDIFVGGANDRLFGILCDKIGKSEWKSDPRFVTNNERVHNRAQLEPLIEEELTRRTTREWQDLFEGSGLPYAAVNDVQGTMNHEHGMKNLIMILEIVSSWHANFRSTCKGYGSDHRPPCLWPHQGYQPSGEILKCRAEYSFTSSFIGRTYQ